MNKIFIFVIAIFIALQTSANAQRSDSIAAVVNGDIITYTDLYDRMNLMIKSARMPNTKEFKEKLLPQVLSGIITEQIQLQEAEKLGLETQQVEIDGGFADLAAQNNLKPDQFEKLLKRDKINTETLKKQIKSQVAWGKVIQSEIRPRITITDSEIQSEITRLKNRDGQQEYLVAEIVLPYGGDNNANESDVRNAAHDLSKQLSRDSRKFSVAARQFSQSATAANGGVMGWMTPDQMDDDIALKLQNMDKQEISQPIKTDEAYIILFLQNKRVIAMSDNESAEEKLRIKLAVFTLPNNQSKRQQVNNDIEIFRRDVKGCLDIIKQVTKRDNAKLQEFDDVLSNIPSEIVKAVENTDIGDVGRSLKTKTKVTVPMLCARDGGGENAAIEREIEQRLGLQRIDTLQKRYLLDLIANAYIERRV